MTLRTLVIGSISILLGICFAGIISGIISSATAQRTQFQGKEGVGILAPHFGRYQIASSNDNVFMVDTVTGECWTAANKHWQRLAAPVPESK